MQQEDFCNNHLLDSSLHHEVERFDSPLQNALARFDFPLHNASERFDSPLHDAAGSQTNSNNSMNLKSNLKKLKI
jgi:hypothetical protein